ncbi:MAG: hypothetical protein C4291_14490 [Candidatus Dadabacteria bacterium]
MPVQIKYKRGVDKVTVCVGGACERVKAEDFFKTTFMLAMKFITERKARATATIMAIDEEENPGEDNPVYMDEDEEENPGEERPLFSIF